MLDIFSWNVRGFNNSLKRRSFRKWLRQNKPSFGSILETRVREHKALKHVHSTFPGWNFVSNYEFAELGRIWILWDDSVKVQIHSKSKQQITCFVQLPNNVDELVVSFVYAVNCKYGRRDLWEEVIKLAGDAAIYSKPWVLAGDFNQILNPSETSNGGTRINRGMMDFRDCLESSGLCDLTIRGNLFSWWNKQEQNPIAKKLDRILVNDNWLVKYPLSYAHFGDADFSDHCPGSVVIRTLPLKRSPFKISHFLIHHRDFLHRVHTFWEQDSVEGTCMYVLAKKLKALKYVLKDLNKEHFSNLELRVKEAHLTLLDCQQRLMIDPSSELASLEKAAHLRWTTLALAEERFILQRSRVKWLASGDSNSSFFHKMVASRHSINQIHYLIDSSGLRLDDTNLVKAHCVEYFTKLLGGPPLTLSEDSRSQITSFTPFRCDAASKVLLLADVTREDVKKEVFALPRNKSPGPDGFTGEFFRASWDVIGNDLTNAVLEFFRSGKLLKQWNCTLLCLIPKCVGADKIGDFRPIALCNAVYKIISKILAKRLQTMMPSMISNNQSAFVKGRLLVENVLLATEMVQGFNQKHMSARGMLKVDLRKAFDSVSWDFILHIFKAVEFPTRFINWIEQCVTTTTFSLSINGESCGFFKGTRGLRQGVPLSPTLFVMAIEVYSNLLASKFDNGTIGFHPLGREPKITHLAFVDDIMIFFNGKKESLTEIAASLNSFQLLSGLTMNINKTELFLGGTSYLHRQGFEALGFSLGTMPIRYLGLPLLHRKLKKADYSPLIDSINKRLNHWTSRSLSFAGRLQLLHSVIFSLINFWFSAFLLPKGCLKSIEKLCNKFLWSGDMHKKATAKVSWKTVCLPKEEGGLGLRNFYIWNQVINLKLIWLMYSNSASLWVAWTKEHYLKRRNLWTVEDQGKYSWIFKSLISLKPLVRSLIGCTVGNGLTAKFWHDNWVSSYTLIEKVGPHGPIWTGIHSEATVSQACDNYGWRIPSRRSRNQRIVELSQLLQSLPTPHLSRGEDIFTWGESTSRHDFFSTSRTWELLRPSDTLKQWHKAVWFKLHVPKHAFTFWVCNLDRLPVRSRLVSWGLNVPSTCCFCDQEENRDHLMLKCCYSTQFWTLVLQKLGHPTLTFNSWSILISWMLTRSRSLSSTLKKIDVQATVYSLWREWNNRIHESFTSNVQETFKKIDRVIRDTLREITKERLQQAAFSMVHIQLV